MLVFETARIKKRLRIGATRCEARSAQRVRGKRGSFVSVCPWASRGSNFFLLAGGSPYSKGDACFMCFCLSLGVGGST